MMCFYIFNDEAGLCRADLLDTEDFIALIQLDFVAVLFLKCDLLLGLAVAIIVKVLICVKVDEHVTVGKQDTAVNIVNHLVRGALDDIVFEFF